MLLASKFSSSNLYNSFDTKFPSFSILSLKSFLLFNDLPMGLETFDAFCTEETVALFIFFVYYPINYILVLKLSLQILIFIMILNLKILN